MPGCIYYTSLCGKSLPEFDALVLPPLHHRLNSPSRSTASSPCISTSGRVVLTSDCAVFGFDSGSATNSNSNLSGLPCCSRDTLGCGCRDLDCFGFDFLCIACTRISSLRFHFNSPGGPFCAGMLLPNGDCFRSCGNSTAHIPLGHTSSDRRVRVACPVHATRAVFEREVWVMVPRQVLWRQRMV